MTKGNVDNDSMKNMDAPASKASAPQNRERKENLSKWHQNRLYINPYGTPWQIRAHRSLACKLGVNLGISLRGAWSGSNYRLPLRGIQSFAISEAGWSTN